MPRPPCHPGGSVPPPTCPALGCPQPTPRTRLPCPVCGAAAPPRGSVDPAAGFLQPQPLTPSLALCQPPWTFLPVASRLFPGRGCGGPCVVPGCARCRGAHSPQRAGSGLASPRGFVPRTKGTPSAPLHPRAGSHTVPYRAGAPPMGSPAAAPWLLPHGGRLLGGSWAPHVIGSWRPGLAPCPRPLIGALLNGGRDAGAGRGHGAASSLSCPPLWGWGRPIAGGLGAPCPVGPGMGLPAAPAAVGFGHLAPHSPPPASPWQGN